MPDPTAMAPEELTAYEIVLGQLRASPHTWLVTGVAGFIGSNLAERLVSLGQAVVGLDNFATGYRRNIEELIQSRSGSFRFIEGDIRDLDTCREACEGVDFVLHQAALGSVPRSIKDPLATHQANVNGFVNMLIAARDADVKRFVYAASSSTYGDHPGLPKVEDKIGQPLSPYAVTKYVNELYASVFHRTYGLEAIGLRYFNVFGRRQDPNGAYAAVIPKWVGNLLSGATCYINGDGETSRDFCYVDNVVQANLLAATTTNPDATGEVFNVAVGDRTTLNELYRAIRDGLGAFRADLWGMEPEYRPFRSGDVRHSQADISKARALLGYSPTHAVHEGLADALGWYVDNFAAVR